MIEMSARDRIALAAKLGLNEQYLYQCLTGRRRVPAEHCPAIEAATRRIAAERGDDSLVVTCEQLRPDVQWRVLREQAA